MTTTNVTVTPNQCFLDVEVIWWPIVSPAPHLLPPPPGVADVDLFYAHYISWTHILGPQVVGSDDVVYAPALRYGQGVAPGLVVDRDLVWHPLVVGGF